MIAVDTDRGGRDVEDAASKDLLSVGPEGFLFKERGIFR